MVQELMNGLMVQFMQALLGKDLNMDRASGGKTRTIPVLTSMKESTKETRKMEKESSNGNPAIFTKESTKTTLEMEKER